MVDALKPCPFCGSDAFVFSRENGYWAYCSNDECGAETQGKTTYSDAVSAWNRRSTPSDLEALRKRVAELEKALEAAASALDEARWGPYYADEYFQNKHDLKGDMDRIAKQASVARRLYEGEK